MRGSFLCTASKADRRLVRESQDCNRNAWHLDPEFRLKISFFYRTNPDSFTSGLRVFKLILSDCHDRKGRAQKPVVWPRQLISTNSGHLELSAIPLKAKSLLDVADQILVRIFVPHKSERDDLHMRERSVLHPDRALRPTRYTSPAVAHLEQSEAIHAPMKIL